MARRSGIAAAVSMLVSLLVASGASANGTLDQSQTRADFQVAGLTNIDAVAQTFTTGITGQLVEVDLALASHLTPVGPLKVEIRQTVLPPGYTNPVDSIMTSSVLASADVPTTLIPASNGNAVSWVPVKNLVPVLSIQAGTVYGIVVYDSINEPLFGSYSWGQACGVVFNPVLSCPQPNGQPPYAGGKEFTSSGGAAGPWNPSPQISTAFQTFVIASDFSIVASALPAVPQGGSATSTITTSVTAGSPQPVTLSTGGLPAGVSASFVPNPVTAGSPSTLTLTAATTAALGTTIVIVSGTAGSDSHSVNVTLTVNPASMDHLMLTPATSSVPAGIYQRYRATAVDLLGNSLGDVTPSTTFTIAPEGQCAFAQCSATLVGVTHTVIGSLSGKTGTASLAITAGLLDRIVLSPSSASTIAGQSQTYTVSGFDSFGNSLGDVTSTTSFTVLGGSCVQSVCTAYGAGVVQVTGTNVTGTGATKIGTATLTVSAAPIARLLLNPSSPTVAAGDGQAYIAVGSDQYGNPYGFVTSTTTFTIDGQPCIKEVCTATVVGVHTVTGKNGNATATATQTVIAGPLDHLLLAPALSTIAAGGSQTYSATGYDLYGNSLGDVTTNTVFSVAGGQCNRASCTATSAGVHLVTGAIIGQRGGTANLFVDTTPPVLTLPGDVIVYGASSSGAVVTYTFAANDPDDLTASLRLNCSPQSGSKFPIGNTTVTCIATDPVGNSATGHFNVTLTTDMALTVTNAFAHTYWGWLTLAIINFTDADPNGTTSQYSATIDWGDHSASVVGISGNPQNRSVIGIHFYAKHGLYTITVTIRDVGGATVTRSMVVNT